jgi:hypothetical protein
MAQTNAREVIDNNVDMAHFFYTCTTRSRRTSRTSSRGTSPRR